MKKKNIYFNKVTVAGFVKDLLIMMRKKWNDHCHVIGKFRGVAHWGCNINFQLTRKVPVIFHNLRGHNSHLILNELDKFDAKINLKKMPNGLEKYIAFFSNKNFDSMQFMNSSLHKPVKNLSDEDSKYSVEEFGFKNLELLKQKGDYP